MTFTVTHDESITVCAGRRHPASNPALPPARHLNGTGRQAMYTTSTAMDGWHLARIHLNMSYAVVLPGGVSGDDAGAVAGDFMGR